MGAGGWRRLNEDTGDTLVKDIVIAGPGKHNQWQWEKQPSWFSEAAAKGKIDEWGEREM